MTNSSKAFIPNVIPFIVLGNAPMAIGFGPSFVITQFTSITASSGRSEIAPLFNVFTVWISPYSYRWIPLSYKPHHYKMLHLVPLILLVCLVMLDLYINQITFFLIVEQLQLVSHLSHMLQDLAGGQLSSESNIDDMDSAIIATLR